MILIEGDREALYQWDLNQRIVLTNISAGTEVHFSDSNDTEECCPVLATYEEEGQIYADIPNIFLQKSGIIYVYIYVQKEDKSYTSHHAELIVLSRKKPADYVYTETEVLHYKTLEQRLTQLESDIEKALDNIIAIQHELMGEPEIILPVEPDDGKDDLIDDIIPGDGNSGFEW